MLSLADAKKLALQELERLGKEIGTKLILTDDCIKPLDFGWIFFPRERIPPKEVMVGCINFMIDKYTGQVIYTGSRYSSDVYIEKYSKYRPNLEEYYRRFDDDEVERSMKIEKEITVEHVLGKTTIRPDRIVIIDYNDYAASGNFTLSDIQNADATVVQATGWDAARIEPMPVLLKARKMRKLSKEVRDYVAENAEYEVLALLIESPLSKIAANLFLKFNKPQYPTRIFTDEEKAMEWLKSYL